MVRDANPKMKIQVIDNSDLIVSHLTELDNELVCSANEIQALNSVEQLQPGLVFLNYAVCGEKTPEYIRELLNAAPATSVLVIAERLSEENQLQCLMSGAKGFQLLEHLPQYQLRLVAAISNGEAWVSRIMVAKLLDRLRQLSL